MMTATNDDKIYSAEKKYRLWKIIFLNPVLWATPSCQLSVIYRAVDQDFRPSVDEED